MPATAPLNASGQVASGRVTESASELVSAAPGPTTAPLGQAVAPVTEAVGETPAPATPTATTIEKTPASQIDLALDIMAPMVSNPVTGVGIFLALLWILAVVVYRRRQGMEDAPEKHAHTAPQDPVVLPRGLQAEILALDLELGPAEPLPHTSSAAVVPQSLPPGGADLNLRKLQWAQQLLAAGDNELARVLLVSVAQSLQAQLLQQEVPLKGNQP